MKKDEEIIGWIEPLDKKTIRFSEKQVSLDADEKARIAQYPVYKYKDYSGKSGVYAYAYSPDKKVIYIYFTGKKKGWYKYDDRSASSFRVEEMINRAKKGWGLNRYLNKKTPKYYWSGRY